MNINEIIKTKRDQKELTTEQIDFFVREYSLIIKRQVY